MRSFLSKCAGVVLVALMTLSGCVVVEEPGPIYPPPGPPGPGPIVCPQIYAPVCGERGGNFETFPNQCTANARGFRVVYDGECRRGPPPFPPGPPSGPQFCTREYNPVCARRGPVVRTFGNACSARAEGFQIIHGGQCGGAAG